MATKTARKSARKMNRTHRLRMLATPAGMKKAAAVQRSRRGEAGEHRFILGAFCLVDGKVVLRAVMCGPAYDLPRPPVFTDHADRMNRWRTRQACHQFCLRYKLDLHVIDLHFLDVMPEEALQVTPQSRGPLSHLRDRPAAKASNASPSPRRPRR